jgi:hypothetical protein
MGGAAALGSLGATGAPQLMAGLRRRLQKGV